MRALLFIALRHLAHDRFRTAISVGGVSLGVAFMILMSAMMTGLEAKFVEETIESSPHLSIFDEFRAGEDEFAIWAGHGLSGIVSVSSARPRDHAHRIKKPYEVLAAVRADPRVSAAALNAIGTAILNYGSREVGATVVGIDPVAQDAVVATDKYLLSGRLHDLHSSGGAIILGRGLAEKLGVVRGDSVGARLGTGEALSLKVVGVFKTGIVSIDNQRAYTLVTLAQQVLGVGSDVNRVVVRLHDHARAREVAADIERNVSYKAESWQEANANFLSLFVLQQVITYIVTGGIMIVAGFGILNVLVMLVMEKYSEIAMLKSMGYTTGDIGFIFLTEGLVIGILGVTVGCIAGYHMVELVGSLPIPVKGVLEADHLAMNNVPRIYAIAASAALLSTIVAAVLPALKAARIDPVITLRGHV